MSKAHLHLLLFGILFSVGIITIWNMIQSGDWEAAATAVVSVIGTILTLDVTKNKESESE